MILSFCSLNLMAQQQTAVKKFNLNEVRTEFDEANKDKPVGKFAGYKQFKRWEYLMETKTDPDGYYRNTDEHIWNALQKTKNNGLSKSSSLDCNISANWTEIGPRTVNAQEYGYGRINSIKVHDSKVYIAAPYGGIWVKDPFDLEEPWMPIADQTLPVLGVTDFVIHPEDANTIYVASGDEIGNSGPSALSPGGVGLLKTTDGGNSWGKCNIDFENGSKGIRRIIMHPEDPDIIYLAARNGLYKQRMGLTLQNSILLEANFGI